MKKSTALLALALFTLSTGAQAAQLQTRLSTEIMVQMENGKWNYGPELNISSLVTIPKDNFDPTQCRIDVGQGRLSKKLIGEELNPQPCIAIPGTSRIIVAQDVLKEFALMNALYKMFGSKKLEARIEHLFKTARLIRGSEGEMTPAANLWSLVNRLLGQVTRTHTLDLHAENTFYLVEGNETVLQMYIRGKDTKVIE